MYPIIYPPFGRRIFNRADLANRTGIPIENTVMVSVEATRVVLRIQHGSLGLLPGNRGVLTLVVEGLPTIADGTLPVFVYDGHRTKPLIWGTGAQMTAAEFANGHHYWFCYNKGDNTVTHMNAQPTPAPTEEETPPAG